MNSKTDANVNHVVKPFTYVLVFLTLLALTAATVRLSYVDLGEWHSTIGLSIAAAKAILIVLFFMHAIHSPRMIWIVALSGLAWLSILILLTLTDYRTRSWLTY